MSDSWNDYVDTASDEGDAADTSAPGLPTDDQTAVDDIGADLSDATTAADWSSWDQATADDQSASADSYLTDAQTQIAEGNDAAASQDLWDAGAQESSAVDSQAAADDYGSQADASLTDASADLTSYESSSGDSSSADSSTADSSSE